MSDDDDYEFKHLTPKEIRRRDGLFGVLGVVALIGIFLFIVCWVLTIILGNAPCFFYEGVWLYPENSFPVCVIGE